MAAVVFGCITFNLPRFFEYRIITVKTETFDNATNTTSITEYLSEDRTQFGENKIYKNVYKVYLTTFFQILIPIILLISFTIRIVVTLHQNKRRIAKSSGNTARKRENPSTAKTSDVRGEETPATTPQVRRRNEGAKSRHRSSQEITMLLITVVVVAIVCQSPLCVFHFVRYSGKQCGGIVYYLNTISKLLVNVNSSINFVLYCLMSRKFRKLLVIALQCKPLQRRNNATGITFDGISNFFTGGGRSTVIPNSKSNAVNAPNKEVNSEKAKIQAGKKNYYKKRWLKRPQIQKGLSRNCSNLSGDNEPSRVHFTDSYPMESNENSIDQSESSASSDVKDAIPSSKPDGIFSIQPGKSFDVRVEVTAPYLEDKQNASKNNNNTPIHTTVQHPTETTKPRIKLSPKADYSRYLVKYDNSGNLCPISDVAVENESMSTKSCDQSKQQSADDVLSAEKSQDSSVLNDVTLQDFHSSVCSMKSGGKMIDSCHDDVKDILLTVKETKC